MVLCTVADIQLIAVLFEHRSEIFGQVTVKHYWHGRYPRLLLVTEFDPAEFIQRNRSEDGWLVLLANAKRPGHSGHGW